MKSLKVILKTILSGFTALAILSVLMLGYYFKPLRKTNPNQNTDYIWDANTPWFNLTEGESFGVTDNNGFINESVIDNSDILFLGSSHMESMNIFQKENMCSLLNDKFDGKYYAYNMGISGHTFYKVMQYLRNSLDIYDNAPKYVIIETSDVALNETEVQQALSGKVEKTEVVDTGLIASLQKIPYFRQMYHQLDGGMLKMLLPEKKASAPIQGSQVPKEKENNTIDEKPYQSALDYLCQIEKEYNTKIIVMFHPFETINVDGSISFSEKEYAGVFADYARKYDVGFVDMTKEFEKMYYDNHKVPHGFSTGELGVGHLNKYGHAAISESLYRYINELEVK